MLEEVFPNIAARREDIKRGIFGLSEVPGLCRMGKFCTKGQACVMSFS